VQNEETENLLHFCKLRTENTELTKKYCSISYEQWINLVESAINTLSLEWKLRFLNFYLTLECWHFSCQFWENPSGKSALTINYEYLLQQSVLALLSLHNTHACKYNCKV